MRVRLSIVAVLLAAPLAPPAAAQLEPPSTGGAVALDQALRMLGHYTRVLMVGAHPDDEDTELLTVLVRGMGAETAYLSLTRGEGGQNLIGPELGEALGLVRTEELLAARRLDGARQYFTRAYDFGFSKTIDETWRHWPRDSVLKDVVRIVRRFRPQVIVSVFSGTPRDGHGQHQASAWAAYEAFRVAGDSARFPELLAEEGLAPWRPLKLYRSARFDSAATTLTLQGGALDPAAGQTFHQIAMAGRSRHRSQDMGRLQDIGPSAVRVALVEDRTGAGAGGLFAGLDTTARAVPWASRRGDVDAARLRERFVEAVDSARAAYAAGARSRVADALARAIAGPEGTIEQNDQLRHARAARLAAAGILVDAVASDDRVVPGQRIDLTLSRWSAGATSGWSPHGVQQITAPTWGNAPMSVNANLADSALRLTVTVPDSAPLVTPYFLREPRDGDLYRWPARARAVWGEPFGPAGPTVTFADGAGPLAQREVMRRTNDQALGEIRRPLTVVPRVDVKLEPANELWPAGRTEPRRFTVTLTHGARDTTEGTVRLVVPGGWTAPAAQRFRLTDEDERQTFEFAVRAPTAAATGTSEIGAVAEDARGRQYDAGVFTVDYPHIRPRSYARKAAATVHVAPLALPPLARVGYIRGAADRVPEALRSVGVPVEPIDGDRLARADLSRYDAIVVGPRAYETAPELAENNGRLLAYARGGGLVIVQYQQYGFFTSRYAPFPMTVGSRPAGSESRSATNTPRPTPRDAGAFPGPHDRVTDEAAPVRVVAPGHAAVTAPNRLGPADWEGWVQERGLYFASTWDSTYAPILEMHDDGERPLEGGLLVAPVGRGTYVYTGLSFFRQLPAGVPGAFRLFANLLALGGGAP